MSTPQVTDARADQASGSAAALNDPDAGWRGHGDDGTDAEELRGGLKLEENSRRLLRELLKPHRALMIAAAFIVIVDQAAALVGPLLIAYAIDSAVPALIDCDQWPLLWCVAGYLGAGIVSAITRLLFVRVSARIAQLVLRRLRQQVFDHAQLLSISFHEKYTSGRIISRLTGDLDTIGDAVEQGIYDMVVGVLSVLVSSVALLVLDVRLGLISLVAFIPLYLLTRWFQRRSKTIYRETRSRMASLIVQFVETMNGLRAVQTFRREGRNSAIFNAENDAYSRWEGDAFIVAGIYSPAIRLVGNVALSVVMVVGAVEVVNGAVEIGVLAAFLLYMRRMYDPMDEVAMFYNQFQSASAALEKIANLLAQVPGVPEPTTPEPMPAPHGDVVFTDVSFGYTAERQVLPTFDLAIPAGQTVAVVGATGAGKSTVAKLLARFYDPSTGTVTMDGIDLRKLSTPDLRRGVVMVTQESFLFSGSVADNIALGNPDATREEIIAAAEAVGVAPFVRQLPNGYDTDVRKRGGRLSAGQRQLVAFARAFLADPAVLILDEATASLDIPSERAVQQALQRVLHGRTAVIIAHRLSTVAIADRVLVMDGGRIVEDGSPAELIAGAGRFAALETAWRESLA